MKAHTRLRDAGQSLWMSQVSREKIEGGSLISLIEELSIAGVVISSEAVCRALSSSIVYDDAIAKKLKKGLYSKELAFELILEDVYYAADLLRHVFDRTDGTDGWAVLPVSPLISKYTDTLLSSVLALQSVVNRPNMLITIPGLPGELAAVEEIAFTGIPCNVACIYSHDQFLVAVDAWLRGVERRITAGLKPAVTAFISIGISRLVASFREEMPLKKAHQAAINVAENIYRAMRKLHTSPRWERAYNEGARPLRLIWVGPENNQTTDSTTALFKHLIAPLTVMALPKSDIEELHHDWIVLTPIQAAGNKKDVVTCPDPSVHAARLQEKDLARQVQSWIALFENIARKSAVVVQKEALSERSQ